MTSIPLDPPTATPVSAIPTPIPAAPATPVSGRTAAAILGTMVLLIVMLTAVLIRTSLAAEPVASTATVEAARIAGR